MAAVLRPYQHDLAAQLRAAYTRTVRRVLAVAPTGAGKTHLFASIARDAVAKGHRVWIVAHRTELLDQIGRACTTWDAPFTRLDADTPRTARLDAALLVASVDTLVRRLDRVAAPGLLIIDEAHHVTPDNVWGRVLAAHPAAAVLGVTATPIRLDGTGLGRVFQAMVVGPTVADLTAAGHLVPLQAFAPPGVNLSGVAIRRGDYVTAGLERAVAGLTGDAVAHYRRHADGARGVAFCVSVAHAMQVADAFSAAGIPAAPIHGQLDATTRAARVAALADGTLRVLTSCNLVSEGFDLPALEVGLALRPTASLSLHLQQVGRLLRPAAGKVRAILLDHAGNIGRHGLPDTPREWSLEDGVRRASSTGDAAPRVRVCGSCFAACPGTAICCVVCGAALVVPRDPPKVIEADLVPVAPRPTTDPAWASDQRAATSLAELTALAKRRGYANPAGWAWNVMEARKAKAERRAARDSRAAHFARLEAAQSFDETLAIAKDIGFRDPLAITRSIMAARTGSLGRRLA